MICYFIVIVMTIVIFFVNVLNYDQIIMPDVHGDANILTKQLAGQNIIPKKKSAMHNMSVSLIP